MNVPFMVVPGTLLVQGPPRLFDAVTMAVMQR
jgi:hypothetical protein